MATNAVPARASSDSIIRARRFRILVRTALALLAFWTLWLAADRYLTFLLRAYANRRYDDSVWLSWAGAMVAAGLLFGLATWLPFAKIRFLPSRLLMAAVALLPVAHFWWVFNEGHEASGGWLGHFYWFDGGEIQFPMAAFAGVAIASGFRTKPERWATDAVPGRASSASIIQAWWFRILVRTALALLAFWTLWLAADRYRATFLSGEVTGERVPTDFPYDGLSWLLWAGATVAAGVLFGLATWVPFAKIRFLPSRLLLAAVALLPVAHFWWAYLERHAASGGWLGRTYWFDLSIGIQFVMAAFAGVAIASGFRAKR
ncbi:MAG: hypothetical protein ACRDH0_09515 [Actinomycetota bacterium]